MKLSDTSRYYLNGTNKRFLHLATVLDNIREYICIYDLVEQKCYIEQVIGTQLTFIEDDKVAEEIARFLSDKHVTDIKYGVAAPDYE